MQEPREPPGDRGGHEALQDFVARMQPASYALTSRIDSATAEVLEAFAAAGVDALLLKGPALAQLLYGSGEHRDYTDGDLLVAPDRLAAAEAALTALGYANADSVTGVQDVGGVVHAHTWIRRSAGHQPMIDLHRWLPGAEASPAVAWAALAARRTWIDVAGRRAAVLDLAGQAMHLALHAAQHGPAYDRPLAELALALTRWPPTVWDAAAELAEEIAATDVFAAGLRLVPRGSDEAERLGLPATPGLDWTIRHRAARPRGTHHVRALSEADGAAERWRILRAAVFPRRDWIGAQYRWAQSGGLRLVAAYAVHLLLTPAWAVRAWLFSRRARRAGRTVRGS